MLLCYRNEAGHHSAEVYMSMFSDTTKTNTTHPADHAGINDAIHKASDAIHPAIDQFSAKAHSTVDRLATAAGHGVDNFDLRAEQLSASGQKMTTALREQLQQRPATVLGIAVASGFILSWLLKSRYVKSAD
jgi:membrane protease subunit (stomatin/prohibitin family)